MYKWYKMSQLNQIKEGIEKNLIDERDELIAKHLEITQSLYVSVKQHRDLQVQIENCRQDLVELVRTKNCGPILIRLSWHDAGTYDARDNSGGPHACMRFLMGEIDHAANAGLEIAINLLAPIKESYPQISNADLWSLAAVVAIKEMGGPDIPWRPGRIDS